MPAREAMDPVCRVSFVSPRKEEGLTGGDLVFEATLDEDALIGSAVVPGAGATWSWRRRHSAVTDR